MALSQCESGAVTFAKGLTSTPKSQPMSTHHLNNSWPQPHIFLNSLIQYIAFAEIIRFLYNVTLSVTTLGLNSKTTIMQAIPHTAWENCISLQSARCACSIIYTWVWQRAPKKQREREAKGRLQHNPQKRCWLSCDLSCAASSLNNACRCVKTLGRPQLIIGAITLTHSGKALYNFFGGGSGAHMAVNK
jgi:hypothetical protein